METEKKIIDILIGLPFEKWEKIKGNITTEINGIKIEFHIYPNGHPCYFEIDNMMLHYEDTTFFRKIENHIENTKANKKKCRLQQIYDTIKTI